MKNQQSLLAADNGYHKSRKVDGYVKRVLGAFQMMISKQFKKYMGTLPYHRQISISSLH